jgi:hypothetical protein
MLDHGEQENASKNARLPTSPLSETTANTVPGSKGVHQEQQERLDEGYESGLGDWHTVQTRGTRRKAQRTSKRNAQSKAFQDTPTPLPDPTVECKVQHEADTPRARSGPKLVIKASILIVEAQTQPISKAKPWASVNIAAAKLNNVQKPPILPPAALPKGDVNRALNELPDRMIISPRREASQALTSSDDIPKESQPFVLSEKNASKTTSALPDENIAATRSGPIQARTSALDAPNGLLPDDLPKEQEDSQTVSAPADEVITTTRHWSTQSEPTRYSEVFAQPQSPASKPVVMIHRIKQERTLYDEALSKNKSTSPQFVGDNDLSELDLNDTCNPMQEVVADTSGQFASQSDLFAGPYAEDVDGFVFASEDLQAPSTAKAFGGSPWVKDMSDESKPVREALKASAPPPERPSRPRRTRPHKGFLNREVVVNKRMSLWY